MLFLFGCFTLLGRSEALHNDSLEKSLSIIDILSSSIEFRPLLHALQENELIPFLNLETNLTFIAPSSAAFKRYNGTVTKDLLEYHILTPKIKSKDFCGRLLAPSRLGTNVDKLMAIQNGVPVELFSSNSTNSTFHIGGVPVRRRDLIASNGVVHVIDDFLQLPSTLSKVVARTANASVFSRLLEKHTVLVDNLSNISIFIPSNKAVEKLGPVVISYIESSHGVNDLLSFLKRHIFGRAIVNHGSERTNGELKSLQGEYSRIVNSASRFNIDQFDIIESDIIGRNGMMHIFDGVIWPTDFNITPLKLIYGLNATKFGDLIKFSGLERELSDNENGRTIFVPQDECFTEIFDNISDRLSWLKYHIIPYMLDMDSVKNNTFIETLLPLEQNLQSFQWLKVHSIDDEVFLNGKTRIIKRKLIVGNTVLYVIDAPLSLPMSLKESINFSDISISLENFGPFNDPVQVTTFLPTNKAWLDLGLAGDVLLRGLDKSRLFDIIKFHFLKGRYPTYTLKGQPIITQLDGVKRSFEIKKYEIVDMDAEAIVGSVDKGDILVDVGLVNLCSNIVFPESVIISNRDLIDATPNQKWLNTFDDQLEPFLHMSIAFLVIPIDSAVDSILATKKSQFLKGNLENHILWNEKGSKSFGLLKEGHSLINYENEVISVVSSEKDGSLGLKYSGTNQTVKILNQGRNTQGGGIILVENVLESKSSFNWHQGQKNHYFVIGLFGFLLIIFFTGLGYYLGLNATRGKEEERAPLLVDDGPEETRVP